MGSRLKIVILLYDASTTFNVTFQVLRCKHLAECILYTRTLIFPVNRMKSQPAYYTRVRITCEILRYNCATNAFYC